MLYRTFLHSAIVVLIALWHSSGLAGVTLSSAERAWLAAHPDIRVAVPPDYPPISFLGSDGQPTGLEHDYLTYIEHELGIHFVRVIPTIAQRAANRPQEKGADMVATFAVTKERQQDWLFTRPYLDFPVYLIAHENSPIHFSLRNSGQRKVAVVGQHAAYDFLRQNFPNVLIERIEDTCDGLQRVAKGEVAGVLSDLPAANWCAANLKIDNLKIVQETGFRYRMGMAVRNDWPELNGILQKVLDDIPQAEREEIYAHWNKGVLEKNILQTARFWGFFGAFIILSLLIYRLFLWDKKLKSLIDKRTEKEQLSKQQYAQVTSVFRRVMFSNVMAFSGVVIVMLGAVFFAYQSYVHGDDWMTIVLPTCLVVLSLLAGFLFGSMRHRHEAGGFINQLLYQTGQRVEIEQKLSLSEERLARQQNALSEMMQRQLKSWERLDEIFRGITEISARTLRVERVSIWMFNEEKDAMDCIDLFQKSLYQHSAGARLELAKLPVYFRQLKRKRVIPVIDAMHDPVTVEFTTGYLQENQVGALLDATIWINNEVAGVICHEHVGEVREWSLDEQNFVGSVADMLRLAIETQKRRQAEQALLQYNAELGRLVEERTRSLRENERRFAYIVNNAPISIMILKRGGEIVEINPEAEVATGYSREQAIGKNFVDLMVVPEYQSAALEMADKARRGELVRETELLIHCGDGRLAEFECSVGISVDDAEYGEEYLVAIGQDISQKKALQATLVHAREAAESADRIKSMFVASMSHELRTPLNSIIGFLGVVLQGMSGELNSKQTDQLGRAYHSAKHLLSLISDVIDISKIEAGYLQVYAERFELNTLLSEIQSAVSHMVNDKGLAYTVNAPLEIWMHTDRKRVYQVLLNVVSNAVKYTERGAVTITIVPEESQVRIEVKDTGIGIPKDGLDKLFQPFERMESHLKIKTPGTGLGLYLTRKILTQLLGGEINVSSQPQVGSVFTLIIPYQLPEAENEVRKSILEDQPT